MDVEFYIPYENMKDIPKEKLKDLFKEFWYTIYDLELEYKPYICSSITGNRLYVIASCFACAYGLIGSPQNNCIYCPLDIYRKMNHRGINPPCTTMGSLYDSYWYQRDYKERSKYALQIAKLNWTDV